MRPWSCGGRPREISRRRRRSSERRSGRSTSSGTSSRRLHRRKRSARSTGICSVTTRSAAGSPRRTAAWPLREPRSDPGRAESPPGRRSQSGGSGPRARRTGAVRRRRARPRRLRLRQRPRSRVLAAGRSLHRLAAQRRRVRVLLRLPLGHDRPDRGDRRTGRGRRVPGRGRTLGRLGVPRRARHLPGTRRRGARGWAALHAPAGAAPPRSRDRAAPRSCDLGLLAVLSRWLDCRPCGS